MYNEQIDDLITETIRKAIRRKVRKLEKKYDCTIRCRVESVQTPYGYVRNRQAELSAKEKADEEFRKSLVPYRTLPDDPPPPTRELIDAFTEALCQTTTGQEKN